MINLSTFQVYNIEYLLKLTICSGIMQVSTNFKELKKKNTLFSDLSGVKIETGQPKITKNDFSV